MFEGAEALGLDLTAAAAAAAVQFKVATSSNSSFLARYDLPLAWLGLEQLRLSLMLHSPTTASVQGVVDIEAVGAPLPNLALEFTAAAGEWIDLGLWNLSGSTPRLTLTGLCKPATARGELVFSVRWESVQQVEGQATGG